MARALKKEGKLLLDLHHRDAYIKRHLGRHWERKGNYLILRDSPFDVLHSRLEVKGVLFDVESRRTMEYVNSFREYTLSELRRMLREAGLEIQGVFGDLNLSKGGLSLDCDSVQILATKAR